MEKLLVPRNFRSQDCKGDWWPYAYLGGDVRGVTKWLRWLTQSPVQIEAHPYYGNRSGNSSAISLHPMPVCTFSLDV